MNKYLIGSDPEIFIINKKNEIASGIGIFGGTKEEPINIGNGCSVQEDNILVEFNIPPTNRYEEFVNSINYAKDYIETILIPLDLRLHFSSSERINPSILKDDKAKVFGCAPSYNAINQNMSIANFEFLTESEQLVRSSGFHIHIGYEEPNEEYSERLVMCFELFVTLSLLNKDVDLHNRRMLYGLIGDCRMKEYGVECRSLGGYFLKDEETIRMVWEGTLEAIKFAEESNLSNDKLRDMIQECLTFDLQPIPKRVNELLKKVKTKQLT